MSQQVVKVKLGKEGNRPNHGFKAMQLSQEMMDEDPGAARHVLLKRAKAKITLQDAELRAEKANTVHTTGRYISQLMTHAVREWPIYSRFQFRLNA